MPTMPTWYYVVCTLAIVLGGLFGAILTARREELTRRAWARAGLERGSPTWIIAGNAVIFGMIGLAVASGVSMVWL